MTSGSFNLASVLAAAGGASFRPERFHLNLCGADANGLPGSGDAKTGGGRTLATGERKQV
jgi:hypothetical protein